MRPPFYLFIMRRIFVGTPIDKGGAVPYTAWYFPFRGNGWRGSEIN